MGELNWFGITVTFACPACERTSAEKLTLSGPPTDAAQIEQLAKAKAEKLRCQLCNTPVAEGMKLTFHIQHDTLEHLRQLGFTLPKRFRK